MFKTIRIIATILFIPILVACATAPETFVKNQSGNWITIELSGNQTKDTVWGKVSDSLKERDLEFEKIDRDAGYMRTAWNFRISKDRTYATRVIIDFPSNGKTLRVKTEAQYFEEKRWVEGYDTGYNATIKEELSSILGRK